MELYIAVTIWNRDLLYRNRVFSTCRYVLVRTWNILVQERYISTAGTYQYVLGMYQNNVMYVGPS
jgi:hypothetical protein